MKGSMPANDYSMTKQSFCEMVEVDGEWDYEEAVEAKQQQPQIVAVTVAQSEQLPA
ncbi:MAG: hypothetical protein IKM32_06300 [Clostridia bacterium]|nr:hypothetical protein [Clostridia bacterium]